MATTTGASIHWYVIRVITGQEKRVKQYMVSEIKRLNLDSFIQQILIPTEKVYEMRNNKKRTRERSFLPGYVILQANLQPEIVSIIKDVPSVIGFLGSEKGQTPIPLRESEVNKILGKVDEMNEQGETLENPYEVGERIKVMDGPFSGFEGVVNEVMDEKKKLQIVVKIFGRNTPLELNYLQVERI